MLHSYLESIKYVGHLLPMAFLRIYIGYLYFDRALLGLKSFILGTGGYSDIFVEALSKPELQGWYRLVLNDYLIPNWKVAAFVLIGLQLAVGISYVFGYMVRPLSAVAILLCLNSSLLFAVDQEIYFKLLIVAHIVLAWVGAGRCIGIDYYFFKRRRGIWW